jgi:hypothetical protein
LEKDMQRVRMVLIICLALVLPFWTTAFASILPPAAYVLNEGRTYDQAHDAGYLDWSGAAQYVYVTHRDGSFLPPEEGGGSCNYMCDEWVTGLGDSGRISGVFERDIAYFEVMVAFSHQVEMGNAILQACSAFSVSELYLGSGSGYPGFISIDLPVPAGCRSWSLTAQGGYVLFRSVDVYYSATPATPTIVATTPSYSTPFPTQPFTSTVPPTASRTSTLPPTFTSTPTRTATNTLTPTPTRTATHTPTSTQTPLPPVITGHVSCELIGGDGWCRAGATLELLASDLPGWDVHFQGDLNGVPFKCGASCKLPLSEGVGMAHYTAISATGRTASGTSTWKLDGTPPRLELFLPPVDGSNGWYRSSVQVWVEASDDLSGLEFVLASQDEGITWNRPPIRLKDGVFPIVVRARDQAGNETLQTEILRVDTIPPISSFTAPANEKVLRGNVSLAGRSEDETSGVSVTELSTDAGMTWQGISTDADAWSTVWDTRDLPNGLYLLLTRARDEAGNRSEPDSLSVWVDNHPPRVSLTDRWWIWESGLLKVSPDYFPMQEVQVTISDVQNRWPAVVLAYDPERIPGSLSWDRHFADGALAPSGEYRVTARACDIHGLCGSDTGLIVIPSSVLSLISPTPTSSPTVTPTSPLTATQTNLPVTLTPTPLTVVPELPPASDPKPVIPLPLWQILGLLALMLALASASLVDRRPAALGRLRETFKQIEGQAPSDKKKG